MLSTNSEANRPECESNSQNPGLGSRTSSASKIQIPMSAPPKPLKVVFLWQIAASLVMAGVCGWFGGLHGAVSAILGGGVAIAGGLVFAWMLPKQTAPDNIDPAKAEAAAWDGLGKVLKAEGAKVGVIVVLLWLVLATYKDVMIVGFIGTFILAVIIFSMAVFVRNSATLETGRNHVN